MLTEPGLALHHDWIRHLIDERLEKDADHARWTASDVRCFSQEYEIDPKTDHDLIQIILRRLSDIKRDVEQSDNSLREEVHERADEYALRRYIARKLNERSRRRYTIPQECEIDLDQRPDLRAENPHTSPVSIEVKWAQNWTFPKLMERLETQLVGQYLRAHNSRNGIYLLGMHGSRRWEAEPGRLVEFPELCALLVSRARELVRAGETSMALRSLESTSAILVPDETAGGCDGSGPQLSERHPGTRQNTTGLQKGTHSLTHTQNETKNSS